MEICDSKNYAFIARKETFTAPIAAKSPECDCEVVLKYNICPHEDLQRKAGQVKI